MRGLPCHSLWATREAKNPYAQGLPRRRRRLPPSSSPLLPPLFSLPSSFSLDLGLPAARASPPHRAPAASVLDQQRRPRQGLAVAYQTGGLLLWPDLGRRWVASGSGDLLPAYGTVAASAGGGGVRGTAGPGPFRSRSSASSVGVMWGRAPSSGLTSVARRSLGGGAVSPAPPLGVVRPLCR
uniref:Uncharacterized protein n=1 Tax=Oryza glaberrima TaxID=4538 RepID=I1R4T7_ORYGL